MKNERYQIIYNTVVCGKPCVCLCTKETKSGAWCICYSKEDAEQRVAELIALGYEASYEKLSCEKAWFD